MTADGNKKQTPQDAANAAAEQAAQAFAFNMNLGKTFLDAWTQTVARQQQPPPPQNPWAAFMPPNAPWPWPTPQPGQPAARMHGDPSATPMPGAAAAGEVSRIWIEAVTEATQRTQNALANGEALNPDAFTDVWTKAASELSQAIVSDAAFASMTGQWVNTVSAAKVDAKEKAAEHLRDLGFATHADIEEVGLRLIELERRVHDLMLLVEDGAKPRLTGDRVAGSAAKGGKKTKRAGGA